MTAHLAWAAVAAQAAADPSQLLPAREQMAFTLGFHIILVPFGVAFTFITMIANYRGLRRDDADGAAAGAALVEGRGRAVRGRRGLRAPCSRSRWGCSGRG